MNGESKKEKDDRLSKQLGDFGESLVLFLLGNLKGCKVALVDHVGADIIATDREKNGKRYAISVKSRWFRTDGPQHAFDLGQQEKLRGFADEFDLEPVVAFVCINKEADFLDVYILTLDNLEMLAGNLPGITWGYKNSLHFSNAKCNQKYIQNHELIDHTRLDFSTKQLELHL